MAESSFFDVDRTPTPEAPSESPEEPEETEVSAEATSEEPEEAKATVVLHEDFDTGDERTASVSTPGCEGQVTVTDEPTEVDAPCAKALKSVPQVKVEVAS